MSTYSLFIEALRPLYTLGQSVCIRAGCQSGKRRKIFSLALTSPLAAVLCQDADISFAAINKAQSLQTTTESDDDLNLDPVSEDTKSVDECIKEGGQSGVCVTYYLCDMEHKMIIEDGYTLIDSRLHHLLL
ncbi:unnamed protein product, partial [Iphiclides podalirius]